jgi:hypothetical protein
MDSTPSNRSPAQLAASATRATEAQAYAESMREHFLAAQHGRPLSDREVAAVFNRKGLRTRTCERWSTSSVAYLRQRLGIERSSRTRRGSDCGCVHN